MRIPVITSFRNPDPQRHRNSTITVTATDAHGKAISETFHLAVGDSGPTATAIANQTAYEGKPSRSTWPATLRLPLPATP